MKNMNLRVSLLILLIYVSFKYHTHKIDLMDGRHLQFYFYIFLGGCLTCILTKLPLAIKYLNNKYCAKIFSFLTILIFLFIFLSSTYWINILLRPIFPDLPNNFILNGWRIPGTWLILFIIFFLVLHSIKTV